MGKGLVGMKGRGQFCKGHGIGFHILRAGNADRQNRPFLWYLHIAYSSHIPAIYLSLLFRPLARPSRMGI